MDQPPRPLPWLRILLQGILSIAILAAGFVGFGMLSSPAPTPLGDSASAAIPQVEVTEITHQTQRLDLQGYGTVRPQREIDLVAEVSGTVLERAPAFKKGGFIKEGEVLVKLDPFIHDIEVKRAEANLALAKAELDRIEVNSGSLDRQIKVTKQRVAIAQQDFARLKKLKNAVSKQKLEQSRSSWLMEQNSLLQMQERIASLPAERKKADATLLTRQVELEQAQHNRSLTVIKAPFSAQVTKAQVEVGQVVSSGAVLGHVAYDQAYEVALSVDANQMYKIAQLPAETLPERIRDLPGVIGKSKATVQWEGMDDGGTFKWEGYLSRLEPIDTETRILPLVVTVDDPWGSLAKGSAPLMTGLYCKVTIEGRQVEDLLVIPAAALREGDHVFLLRDDKLVITKVQVLEYNADTALIAPRDGRQASEWSGEQLITSPVRYPVDGMPLRAAG